MMKNIFCFSYLIILSILAADPAEAQVNEKELTGNLSADFRFITSQENFESLPPIFPASENRKSPFLAGLLSLVVPGAGEFYSESYLKAAIFVVVEAAVLTTAIIYDNKGDDQTARFEQFADENWSVVEYAEWLNAHGSAVAIDYTTPGLQPWERVNWSELNAAETGHHKLPPHGDQQYYELIGKYHQYSPGWNDFPATQVSTEPVSPNFLFYAGERGEANDLYNVAAKAVILIYVNHFLSTLDAVWTTVNYNKSLAVKMEMQENYMAHKLELIPALKISYNF